MAHRFEALLASDLGGSALHDKPLMETHSWVVAPSLGAIIPNWLLIIPRSRTLNFKEWSEAEGSQPIELVDSVCRKLSLPRDRVMWFEHGPAKVGSQVGCGLDHAHIHFLIDAPFSLLEVKEAASDVGQLTWRKVSPVAAYSGLDIARSYIALGCGDSAFVAENVDHTGSQFIRRVIAGLADERPAWDYRQHPHHENILRSVETFRELEGRE